MQSVKLELNKQVQEAKVKDDLLNKKQSTSLDKDRRILELQKLLALERDTTTDLRKEISQLKKYHIEEVQKVEKEHQIKYR
jgi:DNA-dependent RNA polymerase auxiliary subunit epsilon